MIGVVLWSAEQEGKAVVWCEDQGDLAFLGSSDVQSGNLGKLVAGDILEFDVKVDGDFRRVNNPVLIKGYETCDVAANLRGEVERTEKESGKLLSFRNPIPPKMKSGLIADIAI